MDFLLTLLWLFWCSLHSLLIARSFERWFRTRWQEAMKFYRLAYNMFSMASFALLALLTQALAGEVVVSWAGPWVFFRYTLLLLAGILFVVGGRNYDLPSFLGLKQLNLKDDALPQIDVPFAAKGIHRMVRHPWYLGGVLFLWSFRGGFSSAELIMSAVLTIYLVVGTLLEEKKLVILFGESYEEYKRQVSMLVPVKYLLSQIRRMKN